MKEFEFLLHTTGVEVPVGGGAPAIGFYTSRRAYGKNLAYATENVLRSFAAEAKIREIFRNAEKAGLEPRTDIENSRKIGLFEQLKPYRRGGLAFYSSEGEVGDCG